MVLLFGILCGIALSLFFSFGPAFFSQLQTSVHYGFHRSVPFAFGVCASDTLIVFLMLTVLKGVDLFAVLRNVYVASAAGAVMIIMGIYTFRKKTEITTSTNDSTIKFKIEDAPRRITVLLRGFVINFINPFIWIFWVTIIALISGEFDIPTNSVKMYVFFIGELGATLGLDILKCKLASLLQRVITAKVMNIVNKCTGVILVIFAGYLVVSMMVYQLDSKAHEKEQQSGSTEMIKKIHDGLHKPDTLKY